MDRSSSIKVYVSTIATQGYAEESDWGAGAVRSKKPFCNAFTGYGRKRADPAMAEDELMDLLAQRIQGIREQVTGQATLLV